MVKRGSSASSAKQVTIQGLVPYGKGFLGIVDGTYCVFKLVHATGGMNTYSASFGSKGHAIVFSCNGGKLEKTLTAQLLNWQQRLG